MKKIAFFSTILLMFISAGSCSSLKPNPADMLKGSSWELDYMTGIRIAFNGLYPEAKPKISFNMVASEINGNTSCNPFSTKFTMNANKINISEVGAMTMRFCEGGGEQQFLNMLYKVDSYKFDKDKNLVFSMNGVDAMRFKKK